MYPNIKDEGILDAIKALDEEMIGIDKTMTAYILTALNSAYLTAQLGKIEKLKED